MAFSKRTHTCGELRIEHASQEVILNGWIDTRRDLGGLIFLDLRDRYGFVQVVLNPAHSEEIKAIGKDLRSEFVVTIQGKVRARPEDARNTSLATGDIEVSAKRVEVLNPALTPPFEISDEIQVSDEIRMRYRYLDLRRPSMQRSLRVRHQVLMAMRNSLSERGFMEVETPFLTKSTPEGARDYLVPSRVQEGRFFALPQSPQLFKQLLMVGGIDRYFQVVKCMRDEDLRADRQPEFTQLDLEMSFVEEEDIFSVIEEVMKEVLQAADCPVIAEPFPRMTHAEAMARYGSDKPDTRFGMELYDLTEMAKACGFKVFQGVASKGGSVKGITAKGCATYSRKDIDGLTDFVKGFGPKGLAWLKMGEDGLTGSIAKFFTPEELASIATTAGAEAGDLVLVVADTLKTTQSSLGELRLEMARRMEIKRDGFAILWVTEFPMFEVDEESGALIPSHHPFTTPREEYEGHLEKEPATLKARAYDLVMNGVELGSGSVRIHQRELQSRIFEVLGIDREKAREKFGFLLDAFEYGAPPHAGIALGIDRMVMLLAGKSNIREVIAFPKTASATCPLTGAPTTVDPSVLEELKIALKAKKSDPAS